MRYDHPEVIEPALAVIRHYDPATYNAMMSSQWDVHVITELDESDLGFAEIRAYEMSFIENNPKAEAITAIGLPGNPTDVILPVILGNLELYDAPLEPVLAAVLVHEFEHHATECGELEAYAASARFASLLGYPKVTLSSRLGVIKYLAA